MVEVYKERARAKKRESRPRPDLIGRWLFKGRGLAVAVERREALEVLAYFRRGDPR